MAQADPTTPARRWGGLLALALLHTALNAFKPLTIDDSAFYAFVAQAAQHPTDPYGFEIFWFNKPMNAYEAFTPPVMVYWWSLALRLFGEQPYLWKLWTLPVSLLLTFALHALFRRFARGLEVALTLMTVLSPAFLPSMNLMLDVPCVALSLAALALFLGAIDPAEHPAQARRRGTRPTALSLAVLAGLVAGLAMQTKYSGFLAPAVLALAAVVFRRPVAGGVALLSAGAVFLFIEGLLVWRYGSSLFLTGLRLRSTLMGSLFTRPQQLWALLGILGGVAPAIFLIGWAGLRGRRWAVAAGGLVVLLAFVYLAGLQGIFFFTGMRQPAWTGELQYWHSTFMVSEVIFVPLGLAGAGIVLGAGALLCRLWRGPAAWRRHPAAWLLVLWLGLEVAGYFAIAPAPGVRRVLGVSAAAAALVGRLAARTCRSPARVLLVRGAAAFGVALGLGYYVVDWCEARAQQLGPELAATFISERAENPTVWYIGHWGFQYYAERLGMKPVLPEVSVLARGDWLVAPAGEFDRQPMEVAAAPLRNVGELAVGVDPVPYRTVVGYYFGFTPLTGRFGPRLTVNVYRVLVDFTATKPSEDAPPEEPE